jgi:hypothetical protein
VSTPLQDAYAAQAAAGIRRVASDGELTEAYSLDELRRAADDEAKRQAAARPRAGIKMFRIRMGGSAPQ